MWKYLAVVALMSPVMLGSAQDFTKDEMAKLQGKWRLQSGSIDGQKMPEEVLNSVLIIFEGDKFQFKGGPSGVQTSYKIDPIKKTIDISPPKGETATLQGIYKFDGKTLWLCITEDKERPIEFEGLKGRIMMILIK